MVTIFHQIQIHHCHQLDTDGISRHRLTLFIVSLSQLTYTVYKVSGSSSIDTF